MNLTTKEGMTLNLTSSPYDVTEDEDVVALAQKHIMYKIGEGINRSYFLFMIPVGIIGNILSFLVMIQKHNRHMSISLYMSVLAVTDTIALILGLTTYLNRVHGVEMYPGQEWYCPIAVYFLFASTLSSALSILSMTFDRFYSIIRPHKAASFNTVKRAKFTIMCIVIFSILYNLPHLFVIATQGINCVPYGNHLDTIGGQFYYWLSFIINFALPFVLLLAMNSVIIHKLHKSFSFKKSEGQGQGHSQGQDAASKSKTSEVQITVILLVVTFSFLILTTPSYVLFLYGLFVDINETPYLFAGFHLFYNVAEKLYFTNNGINFYLYVISGKKFRTDLINLFRCNRVKSNMSSSVSNDTTNSSL